MNIEVRKEKNERMDGKYIVIEFEDGYQTSLVKRYGWSEETSENEVDQVVGRSFKESGLSCQLHWEDREVFLIERPSFSVGEVASVLSELFPGSTIDHSGSLYAKFVQKIKKTPGK